jgi:hypothetical protein
MSHFLGPPPYIFLLPFPFLYRAPSIFFFEVASAYLIEGKINLSQLFDDSYIKTSDSVSLVLF